MKSGKKIRKTFSLNEQSSPKEVSNDLLLDLLAKRKGLVKLKDKEYRDEKGNKFIKTSLGFVRKDEFGDKVDKIITDGKKASYVELKERADKLKAKIGQLNTLLHEAITRKTGLENKAQRLEHQVNNLNSQIDNLKRSKRYLQEKIAMLEGKK
jgi:hypothetical protein